MAANSTKTQMRATIAIMLAAAVLGYVFWHPDGGLGVTSAVNAEYGERTSQSSGPSQAAQSVDLSDSQLTFVKVEPVGEREFPLEKEAIGSIEGFARPKR